MTAGQITLQAEYHKTTLGVPKPDARGEIRGLLSICNNVMVTE